MKNSTKKALNTLINSNPYQIGRIDGKTAILLCGDEVFMHVPSDAATQWCELLNGAYRGGCNKCVSVYEASENLGNSDLSGFEAVESRTTGGTHMMPVEIPIVHTRKSSYTSQILT